MTIPKKFIGDGYYTQEELSQFSFKDLGRNVLIKKNVQIYYPENIIIGDNVRIDDYVVFLATQEECVLESNVHIASHCVLLARAGVSFSQFVTLAPHCILISASDDYTGEKMVSGAIPKKFTGGPCGRIVLKKHVVLGVNTTVFPLIEIAEGVAVGACSLIRKSLLNKWNVYAGNPLKHIKERSQNLLNLEKEYWDEYRKND